MKRKTQIFTFQVLGLVLFHPFGAFSSHLQIGIIEVASMVHLV